MQDLPAERQDQLARQFLYEIDHGLGRDHDADDGELGPAVEALLLAGLDAPYHEVGPEHLNNLRAGLGERIGTKAS